MFIYRIEHSSLQIGPANLYTKLKENRTDLTASACQAIAFAQSLVAGFHDDGPIHWKGEFGEWWSANLKNPERKNFIFGSSDDTITTLLKILKGHEPCKTQGESFEDVEWDFSMLHKEGEIPIRSFLHFEKENLLNLGSEIWRSIFATDVGPGRFVIARYKTKNFYDGPGGQIAFNRKEVLERKVLYHNTQDPHCNLIDLAQKQFLYIEPATESSSLLPL